MNPLVCGPKWFFDPGSEEKEMMVVVLPWKLLLQTTIWACPSGIPFTVCPHLRVIFMAVSTPSAPVFMGNRLSKPK